MDLAARSTRTPRSVTTARTGPLHRSTTLLLAVTLACAGVLLGPAVAADAAPSATTIRTAQRQLDALGYPVGKVDGIDGPRTRRGLCAWRRLSGAKVHRGPLTSAESRAIASTTALPKAVAGRGVTVDKTCQTVAYRQDGVWRRVMIASTGTGGLPKVGDYRIQRTKQGWHTSSLYPSPTPNMYSPMYFSGAIAIHGSTSVPTRPASHGCVRVTPKDADHLFARLKVGDPIKVVGSWS